MKNSKEIYKFFGSIAPSKRQVDRVAKVARSLGEIPCKCLISINHVYGGFVVVAEYYGKSEKTRARFFG